MCNKCRDKRDGGISSQKYVYICLLFKVNNDSGHLIYRNGNIYTDQPDPIAAKAQEADTPGLLQDTTEEVAAPGSMYADPRSIEHEVASITGEEYAMVTKSTSKKKQRNQVSFLKVH